MKLIKINPDHYLVVDNSEIKEGDWFYNPATKEVLYASKDMLSWNNDTSQEHKGWKKITHSTRPESLGVGWMQSVLPLLLSEVKELIGEVDVEKKAINSWEGCDSCDTNDELFFINGYQRGYKQALEDNKNKKYTEEDLRNAFLSGIRITGEGWNGEYADGNDPNIEDVFGESVNNFIQSLHPKTEWEVEFIDGKLKLK